MVPGGVAPVDFVWHTSGVAEMCAVVVRVAVDGCGLARLIAYFYSYVHLTQAVAWILQLVRALRWRAVHSVHTLRLLSAHFPEDGS